MIVRPVAPEDRDAILALAEMHVQETLPHLEFSREVAEANFDALVRDLNIGAFCVERRGEIVGWLCGSVHGFRFSSGKFGELEVIYVRPENRGSRAAALLIATFLEWNKLMGVAQTFLSATNPASATRTAGMFKRFGAEPVGYVLVKR